MEPEGSLQHLEVVILSQIIPVHAFLIRPLKIYFNIILLSTLVFQVAYFHQGSPPTPCMHLSPVRTTWPAHLTLFYFII